MIIQTTGSEGIIYKIVNRRMVESHCDNLFRFNVVNVKNINKQYREAMKQSKVDMEDLDKQDLIIYCEELQQNTQPKQQVQTKPQQNNQLNESDDDEIATLEAVKQILMEDANQNPQQQQAQPNQQQAVPQQNNDQRVQDATPQEQTQVNQQQGQTAEQSKNKQTALKAIAGALFLESPEQLESFDVPFQNKNTFFIKLMIRK